jgi:hypothetical protein
LLTSKIVVNLVWSGDRNIGDEAMKSLSGVIALMLVLTLGIFNVVFAADKAADPAAQERGTAGAIVSPAQLAQACKNKKPGIEVTVGGTKLKCPADVSDSGQSSRPGKPSKEQ